VLWSAAPDTTESDNVAVAGEMPSSQFSATSVDRSAPIGPRPNLTQRADGLRVVALSALPDEAAATWALIEVGGPFPYAKDGATFQNRERLLPRRARGYYREYTIPTHGEDDRGPRRFVVGEGDEVFYTADHYDSFVAVDVTR
jgi:guanyl-specific ribonuclease Sa